MPTSPRSLTTSGRFDGFSEATTMKKGKKIRAKTAADRVLSPDFWREHERVQRKLAERIAHHEAHIAAERGESPGAASA
jgi:hypothetical protein